MSAVVALLAAEALDTDINSFIVAAGPTNVSGPRAHLLDNMVRGMKVDAVYPKLNRLGIFAAENTASAQIDIITRASFTLVNSPTFTTDQGYAGNGTSSYVNMGSNNAGTQNNSTFGFYNRTNKTNGDSCEMGTSISGDAVGFNSSLSVAWSDGNMYFACNDGNLDTGRTAPATRSGIYVVTRTAAGTATVYRAGSSFATNGQTSVNVPTFNYLVGAGFTAAGVASIFSTCQFGAAWLGNTGWNGTDVSNFTTRLQTYMTAIGA